MGQFIGALGVASRAGPHPRRGTAEASLRDRSALTRTTRGVDSEVIVEPDDGVPTRSAVTLDNIATIEQDLLVQYITTLSSDRMNEVWEAVHHVFGMPF